MEAQNDTDSATSCSHGAVWAVANGLFDEAALKAVWEWSAIQLYSYGVAFDGYFTINYDGETPGSAGVKQKFDIFGSQSMALRFVSRGPSLPFKGRVGVGMGYRRGGSIASSVRPIPLPTSPLKGEE